MTNIEFEKIPNCLRKPGVYTEYNAKGAVTTLPTNEQESANCCANGGRCDGIYPTGACVFRP